MGDRIFLPFPVSGFASSCVSCLFLLSDVVQLEGCGSVHPVFLPVTGFVAFILLVHPVIGLAHSLLHDASYLFGVMGSFRLNVEVTEHHSFLYHHHHAIALLHGGSYTLADAFLIGFLHHELVDDNVISLVENAECLN